MFPMKSLSRYLALFLLIVFVFAPLNSSADDEESSFYSRFIEPPGSYQYPNIFGSTGVIRTQTMSNLKKGELHGIAVGQFSDQKDFIVLNDTNRRLIGNFALAYSVFDWLEPFISVAFHSNENPFSDPRTIQSFGNWELGVKGGYDFYNNGILEVFPLALGGSASVKFPTNPGVLRNAFDSTSVKLTGIASADFVKKTRVPIRVNLNGTFFWDNSSNIIPNLSAWEPTGLVPNVGYLDPTGQFLLPYTTVYNDITIFANDISFTSSFITTASIEYVTKYVTPFLEGAWRIYFNGDSEVWFTPGIRVTPTKAKRFAAFFAADIGLIGTMPSPVHARMPGYNLIFGVSYSLDLLHTFRRHTVPAAPAPEIGKLTGQVIDAGTLKPLGDASVKVEGTEFGRVLSDTESGSYTTPGLSPGEANVSVEKEGYKTLTETVDITEGATITKDFALNRREIGVFNGAVTDQEGKPIAATLLIYTTEESFKARTDPETGQFEIELDPGTYQVKVFSRGYLTQLREITIARGELIVFNFSLFEENK